MKTIQLFNGRANEIQDAVLTVEGAEYHATFADGHFVKFHQYKDDGTRVTAEELRALIDQHNADNKPVVTTAMLEAQDAEAQSVLDQL